MGDVRQPGNLVAGLEGVQEEVTATATISDADTSATVTLSLSGDYDSAPEVVGLALSRDNSSAGDGSGYIDGYDVDRANATTDSIDVHAHLDSAPTAGESVDVVVSAWVSGNPTK